MSEDLELYTRLFKKSPSLPYLPEETPKIFIEGEKSDIEKLFDKINFKNYDEAQDLFGQLNIEDKKLLISVCQDDNVRNKVLPKRWEFYKNLCKIINRNFFELVPDGIVEMIGDKLFDDDKSKANLSLIRKDIHHTFSKHLNDLSKPHKPLTVGSILIDSNNYSVLLEENYIQEYKNLRNIKLDDDFNKTIEKLPDGLKKFEMGYKFNKDITLPEGLKNFKMGFMFNNSVTIPEGIETLIINVNFTEFINIPSSLEYLKIGKNPKKIKLNEINVNFVRLENYNKDLELIFYDNMYNKLEPGYQIIIEFTDSLRRGKDIDIKKYQYIQNNNSLSSVSDFYRLN